jgi:hypothetical protein
MGQEAAHLCVESKALGLLGFGLFHAMEQLSHLRDQA